MKLGFRFCGKSVRIFLCLVAFSAGSAFSQDFGAMSLPDVVGAAQAKLQQGDYAGAIPALEEAIKRTEDLTDPAKVEICQNCRFQLARSFFQTGDASTGMPILEEYLEKEPRKQERMALRMMTQGLFENQDWKQIEEVAGRLLKMPDLSSDDLYNANLLLGQALFRQGKWEECIKPLTFTVNKTKDKQTRQMSQIMIVRALVKSESWRELFAWIPRVYRTDAKYDITLNLSVMEAGKSRFKQDDSLNALALYRMVLPREELIDYANKRITKLSRQLTADMKVGIKPGEKKARVQVIEEVKHSIKQLEELPPYEDEVTFRIGQIFHQGKRYWEAYVLFDRLYNQDRTSDIGEAAVLQSVVVLYDLKEVDRAEERIIRYLEEQPKGQYARTLLSMMLRDNLIKKNIEKVVGLRKYVDALPPTDDSDQLLVGADLHYMLAFGYFQKRDFKLSGEQFGTIIDDYKDSPTLADAYYYRGMTHMMQAEYQSAIDDFKAYQQKFPDGVHYPDSTFRQGVCLFGLNKVPEAEAEFTKFINTYPDDDLLSEAYSMRGDIEAAKNGQDDPKTPDVDEYDPHTLDRALADYRKGIVKAVEARQASYAAFKAADVYKLEFKWQEIIDLMNYYMGLWEGQADVAQSVFWIGKSQIALGQIDEAIAAYIDAILSFGDDVTQAGVDKIIRELVTIADQRLSEDDRAGLAVKIKLKLTDVDPSAEVLRLRLQMAVALLEGEEATIALGTQLLDAQQELKNVTPIILAVMCDAAVATGNVEQMGQLFDYFTANFEESDDLWHAYRAKTFQLLAGDDMEAVLASTEEAQSFFGADSFMGWAQIIKADTLRKMKKYKEAEEAYKVIHGVSEWRGPLYGEAMYGMGLCYLGTQDIETAHNLFQRTYLLFKAYDDGKWAADAYLAAADCLLKLGREADAVKTWRDMLEDPYVNTLPQAETAKELIKKHGGE